MEQTTQQTTQQITQPTIIEKTATKKVGIVYFSKTNSTASLAKEVEQGVYSVADESTITAIVIPILASDIIEGRYENQSTLAQLHECDAIIFGTPTYMGNVSAQFKAFIDSTSATWSRQGWADKLAAGFTCGSGANGDQSNTLHSLVTVANQHGMLWVGLDTHPFMSSEVNRLSCQTGVVAQSFAAGQVHEIDLATARYLGARVAKILLKVG